MLVCLLVLWQGMGWADNDRSNLCHQFYYDINGDGTLEYFDTDGIYSTERNCIVLTVEPIAWGYSTKMDTRY